MLHSTHSAVAIKGSSINDVTQIRGGGFGLFVTQVHKVKGIGEWQKGEGD